MDDGSPALSESRIRSAFGQQGQVTRVRACNATAEVSEPGWKQIAT
jgi:hypothetical protein